MELDRDLLEKIRLLDDDKLRLAIGNVAQSMGIDPNMAAAYLGDMQKIKDTVASLKQEDLNQIQNALGQENTEKLVEKIRSEVKGD